MYDYSHSSEYSPTPNNDLIWKNASVLSNEKSGQYDVMNSSCWGIMPHRHNVYLWGSRWIISLENCQGRNWRVHVRWETESINRVRKISRQGLILMICECLSLLSQLPSFEVEYIYWNLNLNYACFSWFKFKFFYFVHYVILL